MLYVMLATDRPDGLALREARRAEHVAYLEAAGARVRAAGRTLDGDGGAPNGSFMICELASIEEMRAFVDGDPFVRAGLYERVEIRPWHWVLGDGRPAVG